MLDAILSCVLYIWASEGLVEDEISRLQQRLRYASTVNLYIDFICFINVAGIVIIRLL